MKKTIIKPSLCISIIAIFAIMVCAEASFALRPRALSERSPDKAQEELIEPISEQDASNKVLKAKSLRGELEDYSGNPDLAVFFNETDSRHYAVEQVAQRRRNDNGKIRILSVGCGDGKGAYSIAIALLKLGIPKERIEVIGVDIIGPAIDVASYGVYSDHDIRKTVNNRSMEGNPFIRHDRKQGAFIISDEARQCVRFKLSNADSRDRLNEIGRQFDLIDCNNVLEWLAPFPVQFSNVLDNFIFSLNDTGLLFLGFFQKQPNMQRVREYVDANQDRIHVIRFPNRPDGQSYSSLDSSILIARSITRGKEARAIMSCVMRATAFDERKDPGAKPAEAVNFLSVAFPFFNMPVSPMHAMIFETAKTRIIHEICLPSEDDPSARIPDNLIDWGGASSVLHARGLYDCYDLQNKCVIHVIDEVKGKKVGELFGFPLSGENDDFENLLPVVSYTSNKDNKLHIFITKRFEQDYLHFFDTEQKRFHLFGSHSAENLKHMRLAEMIEQARFENSAETQTLSPAQKALLSTFKSSVFLPTGRDAISSWHKWVIDMLSLTETGRRYLYSALDAKAPPLENASWQAYLGHLYEYSGAVLKECKAAGYHTRREARHIFRSYHHGDIRAFEEQCRDLGIDPVLLNERIEDIERAHVKNLMRDFKPDRLIFGEATSETDVAIQDSNPIVEKTPKPGKEQEVLESYLKA
ncbi:MAG: methyltransferase domain-containing protein, partial [Candidatus Omnitrophica bacterium]|nr:methyltransferase domain-containing protein [Candidatus Omnitrophota bacterium]